MKGKTKMIGGTKENEYVRSAEHFENIFVEQGPYFALAMLLDSGYERKDLLCVLAQLLKKATF